ncbi:MAG: hemolysin family protein [Pseudanabaena sp. CAN_BIN31]|nr:hemolysin family protein [Pseudanabaena sp. CAN_BIN31]
MPPLAFEALFIILLVIANGVFAMSELAIISARKVRLEQWAKEGNANARSALRLISSPNNFLSTTQIGITLIGILSGALGGTTVAKGLKDSLDTIAALKPYSEGLSFTIVVGIITYLSLVLGELVPKRLAMNNAEKIACAVAPSMRFLANIGTPIIYLLSTSTEALLSLLGIEITEESQVTEEEIKVMIAQGAESGMFEVAEHDMVERVFRLGDRPIKSLMTPRTEIDWLDVDAPFEETQREVLASGHSRFPVGRENLDDCVGIIEIKAFLNASLHGTPIDLVKASSPPLYVAETASALSVLEQFKQSGDRVAIVTDEYGGVEGLVTLTDLLEAIVGDLPSNDRQGDPDAMQREDGSWLIDGMISSDRLKEILEVEKLPHEEDHNYHTLGGLMMTYLRHIPKVGEYFSWEHIRFEVMDMDGNRVDKVLVNVSPLPTPPLDE